MIDFIIEKIFMPVLGILAIFFLLVVFALFYDGLTGKSCHNYAEKFELQSEYDFFGGCFFTDKSGKTFTKTAHKNEMEKIHKINLTNDE